MVKRMQTKILKIDRKKTGGPEFRRRINKVVEILKMGGLVVYPTETCYGIGADVLNESAVKKVFEIKQRPLNKPLTAIISDIKTATKYCHLSEKEKKIVKRFMPGPITLVVKKKKNIPDIFDPKEFAFRIPGDAVSMAIAKQFDGPVVATSANMSGQEPIYDSKELKEIFDGKVNLILDAGKLPKAKPTTVVDVFKGLRIRRPGPISEDELKKIL
ncbi:MAG: threonylcarbamoyl-AMP synthase [Candidatus Aenigmarchaeota archaeon]|nr:threonylcarbamoyl-AMP synthase [Candidatus Aenigmarchaeota archaeon]